MSEKDSAVAGVKTGVLLGTKNYVVPAIDFLISFNPDWFIPWMIIRGSFAFVLDYQQERINMFAEGLIEKKDLFPKELLKTEEFRNAFVVTYEAYSIQRNAEKRKLIQKIFYGYASDEDKSKFQLERLYRMVELISLESIEFLGFVSKNVWLSLKDDVESGESLNQNLSEVLGKFFDDRTNQTDYENYFIDAQEHLSELTALGILRNKGTKSVTYNGEGKAILGFTKFGASVMKFLIGD